MTQPRSLLQPDMVVDGYRIRERVGAGCMGEVYRARDAAQRQVALKVIRRGADDPEDRERFTREGQALAAIPPHPNIVHIHGAGHIRGHPYLVMDYIRGRPLDHLLRRGPLPIPTAASITADLARAVHHAHQAGVLHRDIKPENVLLHQDDRRPILTDFGLASLEGSQRLTETGDLIGTPGYMPPEQITGKIRDIGPRSEVWSLGVLLFELLTAQVPFPGSDLEAIAEGILYRDPPPIHQLNPDVDGELVHIIGRALRKKPRQRFATPAALAEALDLWAQRRAQGKRAQRPWHVHRRRRRLLTLTALLALAATTAAALHLHTTRSPSPTTPASLDPRLADVLQRLDAMIPHPLGAPPATRELDELRQLLQPLRDLDPDATARADLLLARLDFERALDQRDLPRARDLLHPLARNLPSETTTILAARLARAQHLPLPQSALRNLLEHTDPDLQHAAAALLAHARTPDDLPRATRLLEPLPSDLAQPTRRRLERYLALQDLAVARLEDLGPDPHDPDLTPYAVDIIRRLALRTPPPWDDLTQALRNLAFVGPPQDPTPATLALFAELLSTLTDHWRRGRLEIERVLTVLDPLARVGLVPGDAAPARDLLDQFTFAQISNSAGDAPTQSAFVLALIRLDADILREHLANTALPRETFDPAARYLQLRLGIQHTDGDERDQARRNLYEFALDQGRTLGPRTRAMAVAHGIYPGLDPNRALETLDEVLALDPTSPWARLQLASCLFRRGDPDAATAHVLHAEADFRRRYENCSLPVSHERFYRNATDLLRDHDRPREAQTLSNRRDDR